MKQAIHTVSHCPPYLLFLLSFGVVVAYGFMRLHMALQGIIG